MCVKFSDLTLTFTNYISTHTIAVSTYFYVKEVGADQVGQNNQRQVPEYLYHWLRGGNVRLLRKSKLTCTFINNSLTFRQICV